MSLSTLIIINQGIFIRGPEHLASSQPPETVNLNYTATCFVELLLHLLALAIIEVTEVRDERLFIFSSLAPSSCLLPPLYLLRASLWNMAGRKESTIGVLSSDRCPCCAFSSHCEQALGRHPHKTWKDLTCVQNSSTESQARCRSLKQTRTHAGTTLRRRTTYTKRGLPFGLQGTCLRKANTRRELMLGDWHIGCISGVLLCERTISYSCAASLAARRIDEML